MAASTRSPTSEEPKQHQPIYSFRDIDEFARIHKAGTQAEFAADEKSVYELNRKSHLFHAWAITKIRQTTKRCEYLFLVKVDSEVRLPGIGEICKLRIVVEEEDCSRYWECKRVENPSGLLGVKNTTGGELVAFIVTVARTEVYEGLNPLVDASAPIPRLLTDDNSISTSTDSSSSSDGLPDSPKDVPHVDEIDHPDVEIELSASNSISVNFMIIASEATKDSELGALELLHGPHQNSLERQQQAFKWFVTLKDPGFFVNLYDVMPHIRETINDPAFASTNLGKMFHSLNTQQKNALLHGFSRIPCGICVLPGGPGAGKTHFNLFTIAMAQLRPMARGNSKMGKQGDHSAKVLFIVDMNCPVDDVASRMVRLYKDLGMSKQVIRMKGWGAEVKLSSKLNEAEDAANKDEAMHVDFTNSFIRVIKAVALGLGPSTSRTCRAPTLDEAAWDQYERFKSTKYEELSEFLEKELWESEEVIPLRFRRLVYNLYRDTLSAADFIATTPVAAHNHFKGMFRPDLVYFDEAPHARELCNLIAIANFNPTAWIFCGDYRQTVPYVGSAGPDSENEFANQMRVSMMERAAKAGVIQHELLINHRSFGGLHQLASDLWYQGKMTSGTPNNTVPLARMRRYLKTLSGGKDCDVPRLLVSLKDCPTPRLDGTSCWSPEHTNWVMARVKELLVDPKFLQARREELGTILIISPYKRAFEHYKKEIKKLPAWARERVEARTVDVVQGHEADFVFLDLVKEKSTEFLDNPNRLCVALTRARLGEIILMHPKMPTSPNFRYKARCLDKLYTSCRKAGQVVTLDMHNGSSAMPMLQEDSPTMADLSKDDICSVDGNSLCEDCSELKGLRVLADFMRRKILL